MDKLRLVFISDMHEKHRDVVISECDILFVSGDLTYRGELHVLKDFNNWLGELKEQGIIKEACVISGNHDLSTDPVKREYYPAFRDIFTNCIYLQHQTTEVMGLRIFGSPASAFFNNWGHNFHRGADIQKIWNLILEDHSEKSLDIIMTHGPCYRILDWVERTNWVNSSEGSYVKKTKEYVGDKDLLKVVKEVNPVIFCSGHIHCAYGTKKKGNTLFINASTCTEEYRPLNPPIVVDIEKIDGKWKTKVVKS